MRIPVSSIKENEHPSFIYVPFEWDWNPGILPPRPEFSLNKLPYLKNKI